MYGRSYEYLLENEVWVDTTLTPEESIRLAKEAILDMLSKRFNKVTFL